MAKGWHQKQKARGVKLILTWFEPRGCWKKYKEGKTKYFHYPNSAAGYEEAVAEYHSWLRQEQDSRILAPEYRHHIALMNKCCEWYERFGTPVSEGDVDEEGMREELFELRERLIDTLEAADELPMVFRLMPHGYTLTARQFLIRWLPRGEIARIEESNPMNPRFGSLGWELPDVWKERVRQLEALATHKRKLPQTVKHQVQRFLDFKETQVQGGVIKPRTWGTLAERLPVFIRWIKPGTHVTTIDGKTLTGFYEWLLLQTKWNHQVKKNYFNAARQWIRWAWRQDDVELDQLPRNIDSREFVFLVHLDEEGVSKKTRTERLWTPDEFQITTRIVPEDFQLYLLLMLNCGFTNIDVASLLKTEVQLEQGRIVRQRTKTRRHAHPPLVNYKLWPKTHQLLQKFWSDHPSLALTNLRGNPLGVSKLVKNGNQTRETLWTSIGRRFTDLKSAKTEERKKAPLPNKQLKFLRKTGSTKLRSTRQYLSLDSLYLGHSWATVADKHYNAFDGQPFEPLDEAIEWLGTEFNVAEI